MTTPKECKGKTGDKLKQCKEEYGPKMVEIPESESFSFTVKVDLEDQQKPSSIMRAVNRVLKGERYIPSTWKIKNIAIRTKSGLVEESL